MKVYRFARSGHVLGFWRICIIQLLTLWYFSFFLFLFADINSDAKTDENFKIHREAHCTTHSQSRTRQQSQIANKTTVAYCEQDKCFVGNRQSLEMIWKELVFGPVKRIGVVVISKDLNNCRDMRAAIFVDTIRTYVLWMQV